MNADLAKQMNSILKNIRTGLVLIERTKSTDNQQK